MGTARPFIVRATHIKMDKWDIIGEFPERVAAFEAAGRVMAEHDDYERAEVLETESEAEAAPIAFMERVRHDSDGRGLLPDFDPDNMEYREW